jgi:hypothetical protein
MTRFHVNDADVAAEVFDGEVIILNLATGVYYSLDQTAGLIWTLLAGGHSVADTAATLLGRYDVAAERARADVERVAGDLVGESLIRVAEAPGEPPPLPEPGTRARIPYVAPVLNIYRDMGAMLALDPPMPRLDEIPWKDSDAAR